MINNKKIFLIMVRNDIDVCHPKRGGEKVLFHKHIFKNEFEAREELKNKNLAPGEIAVARFYVNYEDEYINTNTPSYDAIRMIMAIGGATPHNINDTYFFNDSFEVGDNEYITLGEIENILQSYYTKDEVDELIKNIPVIDSSNFATKEDIQNINNNIDNINSSISTVEETIETIQEDIENKVEKTEVYTKEEVDNSFLVIDNSIADLSSELEGKVNSNQIDEIVQDAITNSDTIKSAVDDAINDAKIDEKVDAAIEGKDIITSEKLVTEVSTQIENNETIITLQQTVEKLVDSSIYDGGELPEWSLE